MTRSVARFSALILSATASMALTSPALAQSGSQPAAATLPNTFDGAATRSTPVQPAPAPRTSAPQTPASQPPASPQVASDPRTVAAAEAMLRKTISAMQAGSPNYGDMSPNLAGKVREQSSAITPLIQSFGAVTAITHVGAENGAELFLVDFINQITHWVIAQDAQGKIVVLLFRPAPAA